MNNCGVMARAPIDDSSVAMELNRPEAPRHTLSVDEAIQFADAKARINAARTVSYGGTVSAAFALSMFKYSGEFDAYFDFLKGGPRPRPTPLAMIELGAAALAILAAVVGYVWFVVAVMRGRRNPVIASELDSPGPEGLSSGR